MSNVKNEAKIKNPLIVAIREQLEHRALWMYLLCDEAKKKGLDPTEYAPEAIKHFIELRGIGVVDVRRLFGTGAINDSEKINLVIKMEPWEDGKVYDRLGLDGQTTTIMGNTIPALTIPVRPGRNLAVIMEVAAMNNRQKKMGYNAAQELLQSLGMDVSEENIQNKKIDTGWDF